MNVALYLVLLMLPAKRSNVTTPIMDTAVIRLGLSTAEINADMPLEPPQRISNAPVQNTASAPFIGHNEFLAQPSNQFLARSGNGFEAQ